MIFHFYTIVKTNSKAGFGTIEDYSVHGFGVKMCYKRLLRGSTESISTAGTGFWTDLINLIYTYALKYVLEETVAWDGLFACWNQSRE